MRMLASPQRCKVLLLQTQAPIIPLLSGVLFTGLLLTNLTFFRLFLHSEQVNLKKGLSLGTDVSSPAINGNLPTLSTTQPLLSFGSQHTKPSLGLTGPEVAEASGCSLSLPEVPTPQLKAPSASLGIKNPDVKAGSLNYETPKFSMPRFNLPQINPTSPMGVSGDAVRLEAPNLNLDPSLGLTGPKAGLTGPNLDVNSAGVSLQSPDVDIDGQGGKFKWPHQKWKVPKGKGVDAELAAPDLSVSTPGLKAHVDPPDVDLNTPRVDIQSPSFEADPPSAKMTWPHFKWKKSRGPNADLDLEANLNTPGVSVPKLESDLSAPDLGLKVPKAEIRAPDVDMQSPDVSVEPPSGKISWPHLKWKKHRGPRADVDMDADFNTPDVNLSAPHLKGELNTPKAEMELPKAGVSVPTLDSDFEAPSGKINWPHRKWKKPKVPSPKADVDLNADLSVPDVDVSVPGVYANIDAPDLDLDLPHANGDVKAPRLDVDPSFQKLNWPTLKKPKVKKEQSLDFGAKVASPDLDINGPDVNVNMPKARLEAPKLDLSAPDVDGPSGKSKKFNFKKPKIGTLKGPKADFDADLKAPDVNLLTTDVDLKTPGVGLSGPKVKGKMEGPNLPAVNLRAPGLDSGGVAYPEGKLNLPKFSGPTVKGADLNADVKASALNVDPEVNLRAPNLSLATPDLKVAAPTVAAGLNTPAPNLDWNLDKSITAPNAKVTVPDLNLSSPLKGPTVGVNGDLSAPMLSAPALGELKTPGVNLNVQKPDLHAPEVDINVPDMDSPSGKFKWFNFKKPIIGSLTGDKAEIDAQVKAPGVTLKGPEGSLGQAPPELSGNLSLPDIDATFPRGALAAPDLSAKAPKVDLARTGLNGPSTQLQTPEVASNAHLGDFRLPQLHMPEVRAGTVEPKVNPGALETSLAATAPEVRLKAPNVSTGELDVAPEDTDGKSSPKGKLRWPFKWGFKSGSGMDETKGSHEEAPSFKLHKLPEMNLDVPAGLRETSGLFRQDTETKDYVVSKGIRLPVVKVAPKAGEKVNVFERLQMAKDSLALGKSSVSSANAGGAGSTFKVDPLEPGLSLAATELPALNNTDKLSFGLSNMLGLSVEE